MNATAQNDSLKPPTRLCRYFQIGHCRHGTSCAYLHDESAMLGESQSRTYSRGNTFSRLVPVSTRSVVNDSPRQYFGAPSNQETVMGTSERELPFVMHYPPQFVHSPPLYSFQGPLGMAYLTHHQSRTAHFTGSFSRRSAKMILHFAPRPFYTYGSQLAMMADSSPKQAPSSPKEVASESARSVFHDADSENRGEKKRKKKAARKPFAPKSIIMSPLIISF